VAVRITSRILLGLTCLAVAAVTAAPASALLKFERSTANVGTGGVKGVALADVNGDGRLDLVTRNVFAYVAVAIGSGDGSFGTPRRYRDDADVLVVKDVSRDRRADVVTLDGERVWVRLGRKDGRLGGRKGWLAGRGCRGLAVADVTRDGRRDLIVTSARTKRVVVLAGRGDGTFRAPVGYACGSDPRGVAVGDVNGDRRPDLVVANSSATRVSVVLASRSGFGARKAYPVSTTVAGLRPVAVALGDADRDGDLDIFVSTEYMPGVSVLAGDGAGHFTPRSQPIPFRPVVGFATRDVTGDGALDVVSLSGASLLVVPGVGSGEFRGPQSYEWANGMAGQGHKLGGVAVGDIDGDERPDIAAVSGFYGDVPSVCVFRNSGLGATSAYSQLWQDPGSVITAMKVDDLDGDQRLDVVMPALGALVVNYGAGDGTVAQRETAVDDAAYDVVTARLDADDAPDLVYTTLGHVGVALDGGGRSFSPPTSYTNKHPPVYIAAGDLDGDDRAELAVASGNYDNSVSVRRNDGTGSFGAETVYATFGPPNDVEIGDMDGDGLRDVVVASGGWVSIFPGDGTGGLGMRRDYDAGSAVTQLRLADLDGDGRQDVVTDGVAVLLNEGDGALGAPSVLASGGSVDVADVNHDGVPDIVTCAVRDGLRSVFVVLLGDGGGAFTSVETEGATGLIEAGDFDGDHEQDLCVCNQIGVGGVLVYLGTGEW
jgi:hypothetical protein